MDGMPILMCGGRGWHLASFTSFAGSNGFVGMG